mgnify:CR=1 FL=1
MAKLSSEEVHNLYLNIINNDGMPDFTSEVEKGGKQLEKLRKELSETNKTMLALQESGKGDAKTDQGTQRAFQRFGKTDKEAE